VSAVLIAFPIVRRCKLIDGTAAQMLARPSAVAEKHLQAQVRRQGHALRRKQLPEDQIARQMQAFEAAVRAALWRHILTPDGVA
jgi:hypothetical protein